MSPSEPRFEELTRDTVEYCKEVIFFVDPDLRITYCNPAWDKFALANEGTDAVAARVLTTDLMRVIPDSLRDFYTGIFERCLRHHLTCEFDYECSSAEVYRLLHMDILPLKRSGELAFVNSIRVEHIHGPERLAFSPAEIYFGAGGLISMCCHCRRSRRQDASGVWDWVPAFLDTKRWDITHGLCPVCQGYFYSKYFAAGTGFGP